MMGIEQSGVEMGLEEGLLEATRKSTGDHEIREGDIAGHAEEAFRAQRRLIRLGLDLHDGPLQDVVGIGMELAFIRSNLSTLLPQHESSLRVLGQLEDVHARLFALQRDLRELAEAAETPAIGVQPFEAAVADKLDEFERTSSLRAHAHLEGDFDRLTPSQRIALLRILEEACTNARKHSGARNVHVTMIAGEEQVSAEIVDDGEGFDVELALVRAARRGRLGLVGMAERVRLLGGHFDIQSRPGATSIVVRLERYEPCGS